MNLSITISVYTRSVSFHHLYASKSQTCSLFDTFNADTFCLSPVLTPKHQGFLTGLGMDVDMLITSENDGGNVEFEQVENYEEFLFIDNELQSYNRD